MTANNLGGNALQNICEPEGACFAGNLGMEDNLKQQIAKFFGHFINLTGIEGSQSFVGFFQQVGAQAGMGLLAIPGAAIGGTQVCNHLVKCFQ